jgi:hypothetical protein
MRKSLYISPGVATVPGSGATSGFIVGGRRLGGRRLGGRRLGGVRWDRTAR